MAKEYIQYDYSNLLLTESMESTSFAEQDL